MLIDDFIQKCTIRVFTSEPDGLGGETGSWADGNSFYGAIVKNASAERDIAMKATDYASYTLTVRGGLPVAFHDVFKTADGREFRVVSHTTGEQGDSRSPERASFAFSQVSVEEFTE